jgi:hypothetical protein
MLKRVIRPGRLSMYASPNMQPTNTPIRSPGININPRRMLVNLGSDAVLPKVLGSPHTTKSVQEVGGKMDLCSRFPRLK